MEESCVVMLVGEGPVADALVPMAAVLGWTTVTVTSLDEVRARLGGADAVVVTSHHEDLDGPAILAALAHGTPYVGAMGSRRTQARRREWLAAQGVAAEAMDTVHAPIGLDIGADTPGEIAVSILAELVAVRRRGADRATAYCPGG